jgi:arginine-tRNA-protein transferase
VNEPFRFLAAPEPCGYLPDRLSQLEYEPVGEMGPHEFGARLAAGWRRFGHLLFQPKCPSCRACQSLRIDVSRFKPDRSQRRAIARNAGLIEPRIGPPTLTREAVRLFSRFHQDRAERRGWEERDDSRAFAASFLSNPLPTEEWRYELDGSLVGLGYVDATPIGLSAIYFVHDPDQARRSLGTWNVLRLIEETRRRGLPHAYLGYHVRDCLSLSYKASFRPHEVMRPDGTWQASE